jgi:hypothetical protein
MSQWNISKHIKEEELFLSSFPPHLIVHPQTPRGSIEQTKMIAMLLKRTDLLFQKEYTNLDITLH